MSMGGRVRDIHQTQAAPHNLEAERAVLGACLVSSVALSRIVSELEPVDFYSETHRTLFSAIRAASREHTEVDQIILKRYIPKEFANNKTVRTLLFEIIESVPSPANAFLYSRDVLSASRARAAMDSADKLKAACLSGVPEEYENAPQNTIAELEGIIRRDTSSGARPISEGLEDLAVWMHEARENKGVTGIRTGIPKLDAAIKGLNPGRFYVIAGRPGSGKSLICAQIALEAARQGKRVLLCSPEMRLHEYLRRLATASAGVSAERVEEGRVTEEEEKRIFLEGTKMDALSFFVDDKGTQTVAEIRRNVLRHEPDLLVVDYLQRLMPDDRKSTRYDQVSQMSFDLDRIKKDFSIPVIAAAQLNRSVEQRKGNRPMLSDLRDSGGIEQDADAVVMLYRPSHYEQNAPDDTLEFSLEKNRHGSLYEETLYIQPGMRLTDRREERWVS